MAHYVVIPAAGTGSRMKADLPKQYLMLNHQALIAHCLDLFSEADEIDAVYVVLSEADNDWETHVNAAKLHPKVKVLSCGGATRAQTVLNGLIAIADQVADDDWILVHDAARPGLSYTLLKSLIDQLKDDAVGGLLALPLADTLKRANTEQRVAQTIPRNDLWQAQTPQMFKYAVLKKALMLTKDTVPTDEAQAIEALGLTPKLINGALRNLKVTYPQDLIVVSALMQQAE